MPFFLPKQDKDRVKPGKGGQFLRILTIYLWWYIYGSTVLSFPLPFLKEMRARDLHRARSLNIWSPFPACTLQHRVAIIAAISVVCTEECKTASIARRNLSVLSIGTNWSHHTWLVTAGASSWLFHLPLPVTGSSQIQEVQKVSRLLFCSLPLKEREMQVVPGQSLKS